MKIITVPNIITGFNAICGCIAIFFALRGDITYSAFYIFLGAFFDFCDGFFARLLKQYSEIGKELDSLSDMVSFGVAPSMIILAMLSDTLFNMGLIDTKSLLEINLSSQSVLSIILLFSPFLIVVFSGLRLAKFNLDTRQSESFIGLTTTANGILIAGFAFLSTIPIANKVISSIYFLIPFIVIQSLLLISEIPMFSLKFKSLSFRENKERFLFLIFSISLIAIFQIKEISIIILSYVIYSIFKVIVVRKK